MFSDEVSNQDSASHLPKNSGLKTSLSNIGVLVALVVVMLATLGLVLGLGALADKHVDKVQMRLKSQRENRHPRDAEPIPLNPSHPE